MMAAPLPLTDHRNVRSPFWAAGTVAVNVALERAVGGDVIAPASVGDRTVT
jgi:hypothetical protein